MFSARVTKGAPPRRPGRWGCSFSTHPADTSSILRSGLSAEAEGSVALINRVLYLLIINIANKGPFVTVNSCPLITVNSYPLITANNASWGTAGT